MGSVTNTTSESTGISDTIRKIAYPSPFFDIARRYLPANIKELMALTRYFYAISSVIHPIINKISEYPVTDILYGDADEQTEKTWKKILEESINIKQFLVEMHIDYHIYGNSFALFHDPFVRYLACPKCKKRRQAKSIKYKIASEGERWYFTGVCPDCKETVKFRIEDITVRNKRRAKVTRVSPLNIELEHNEFNDETIYIYKVPHSLRKQAISNVKIVLDTLDRVVIDAIMKRKDVKLDSDRIYHMKRPVMASLWKGWGTPCLLPVLKDIHYYHILRKANEALALQRIVPLQVLFPQANADVSPFQHLSMSSWRSQVERELAKWRRDPNYIPVMPIPLGNQLIGGDARQMMVTQEQELIAKGIAAGLGVPIEFVMGGLNWSGSSVSLRILENSFLNLRGHDLTFINNHLIPKLARIYRIPKIEIQFKKFKMADDIQAKSQAYNLMQAGFLSRKSVLDQDGYDHKEELDQMELEHIELNRVQQSDMVAKQEIQNTIQIMQTRNNIVAQAEGEELQKQIAEEMQSDEKEKNKVKVTNMVDDYARTLMSQDPKMAIATLQRMNKEMPNLHALVMRRIKEYQPELPQQILEKQQEQPSEIPVPPQPEVTPENAAPNIGQGGADIKTDKSMPDKNPPRRQTGGV